MENHLDKNKGIRKEIKNRSYIREMAKGLEIEIPARCCELVC